MYNIFLDGKKSGVFSTVAPNAVGKGGEIEINSSNLNITNQAQVNTSSLGQGSAGNIVVNVNKIVLNTSGRITSTSFTSIAGDLNIAATVTGRGGLPPNANDPLTPDDVWQDARAASNQPAVSATTNPVKLAPPAVSWVFDGKGKVTLVAAGSQGQPTGTRVVCPQQVR